MRLLMNIVKLFIILSLLFFGIKYFFIYKDVILSMNSKEALEGKIVYSARGWYIKTIKLPACKSKIIYKIPTEINWNFGRVHSPYFSSDASMVVYNQSNHSFDEKIYIMDSDGRNQRLFLDLGDMGALCPSWSPDGKTIAYVVKEKNRQGLYTIKISDSLIERISDISILACQPSWSPDGRKVAFTSNEEQKKYLGNNRYEVKHLGGTYIINIITKKIEEYFNLASEPSLSPDGKMLAYGNMDGFHIVNLDNASVADDIFISDLKIPFLKMNVGTVPIRWSPDGKYVVFVQEVWPGIAGIYVMPINNPKIKIRIGTDKLAIIGMSWGK